ncbi:hypothetical protein L6452_10371 [Arctium lappa]|uniref:Uncharacterized protein n=1 Tax=Arctium lappa TaxID=4217 RepID=A0ACB9DNF2_ARCLA|nr:hypothetical protein L6452_10371 [Arctium lappa]
MMAIPVFPFYVSLFSVIFSEKADDCVTILQRKRHFRVTCYGLHESPQLCPCHLYINSITLSLAMRFQHFFPDVS